jgi:hypothetical protein
VEVSQEDPRLVQRFEPVASSAYLLFVAPLFPQSGVDLLQLADLSLVDAPVLQFGSQRLGVGETALKTEVLPDIEEGVYVSPLLFEVKLFILILPTASLHARNRSQNGLHGLLQLLLLRPVQTARYLPSLPDFRIVLKHHLGLIF